MPLSPILPFHSTSPQPTPSPTLQRWLRPPMGDHEILSHHLGQDKGPLPVSRLRKYACIGNAHPKPIQALGINTGSTSRGLIHCPRPQMTSMFMGLIRSYAGFPAVSLGSVISPLLKSSVSMGVPNMVLTLLLITSHSLQLDSMILAQCLTVSLCFCFYQLLDESSRMAYTVVIYLIIRKGHLR